MSSPARRPRTPGFVPTMQATQPSPSLQALKVCGIVSASDARLVTTIARAYLPPQVDLLLGTIVWPHSKRSVTPQIASSICQVAHASSATPVAVFVDETADEIDQFCQQCGFDVAQLHGKGARESVRERGGVFESGLRYIDVRDVSEDGTVVQEDKVGEAMWRLFDAKGGGTGIAFDWAGFQRPSGQWLLAGGLHDGNVAEAVRVLAPDGVDVASGVAGDDRCRKDESKLRRFMESVVEAYAL